VEDEVKVEPKTNSATPMRKQIESVLLGSLYLGWTNSFQKGGQKSYKNGPHNVKEVLIIKYMYTPTGMIFI